VSRDKAAIPSVEKVVRCYRETQAKTFKIEVGDPIWYGKYKNKKGIVKGFKGNDKGDTIVVIEPDPKGRKQNKELKLFKIRPRKAHVSPEVYVEGDPEDYLRFFLRDGRMGENLARVWIVQMDPEGYWYLDSAKAYIRGQGFGVEAYMAAIKYATEHGAGLVSDDEASAAAKRARQDLRKRGVQFTPGYVFKTHRSSHMFGTALPVDAWDVRSAVLMKSRRGPAYPIRQAGSAPAWGADSVDAFQYLIRGEYDEGLEWVEKWGLKSSQWEEIEGGDGPQVALVNDAFNDLDDFISRHNDRLHYRHKDQEARDWAPLGRHFKEAGSGLPVGWTLRHKWYGRTLMVEIWDDQKDEQVVLMATRESVSSMSSGCQEDIRALAAQTGASEADVLVVRSAHAGDHQGRGFGRMVYERALGEAAAANLILVPDDCEEARRTSPSAARVWDSLRRRYPNDGDAFWGRKASEDVMGRTASYGEQLFMLRPGQAWSPRLMNNVTVSTSRSDMNKPRGGFWTSTYAGGRSDWLDWCDREGFRGGNQGVLFVPGGSVFHIRDLKSYLQLAAAHGRVHRDAMFGDTENLIDWNSVALYYDGVHFTREALRDRALSEYLYGIDAESTIWFNPRVLQYKGLVDIQSRCRVRAARVAQRWLEGARPIPLNPAMVDKVVARVVRKIISGLSVFRRDRDDSLYYVRGFDPRKWGGEVAVYETTDVRGQRINVPVRLKTEQELSNHVRRYIVGGAVSARYSHGEKFGRKWQMVIKLNSARTPNEIMGDLNRVTQEVRSVVIHEATHLRDLLRLQSPEDRETSQRDPDAYYNLPHEVRAFMQQVVAEVREGLEDAAKSGARWYWRARKIDKRVSSGFVMRALEQAPTWNRVRPFMTEENRRLILKAVATSLTDWDPFSIGVQV